MDEEPDLTSTPRASRGRPFFNKCTFSPTKLFGDCFLRDSSDWRNTSIESEDSFTGGFFSPCRHSPRLLSNGYYVLEEGSVIYDDKGNMSIEPTKCVVSYKENIVRIFRRKRRHVSQRSLDLTVNEMQNVRSFLYEELWDVELDLTENKSNRSSDQCSFVYDIRNWSPARLYCKPHQYQTTKQSNHENSTSPTLELREESSAKSEWIKGKRWTNQVMIFSMFIIFILLSRYWTWELISVVLTSVLAIRLFFVLLQRPKVIHQSECFSKKVT